MEFAYYRFFSPFPFNLGCLIKGSRRFCFTTNFRAVDSRWNPPRMKPTTRWNFICRRVSRGAKVETNFEKSRVSLDFSSFALMNVIILIAELPCNSKPTMNLMALGLEAKRPLFYWFTIKTSKGLCFCSMVYRDWTWRLKFSPPFSETPTDGVSKDLNGLVKPGCQALINLFIKEFLVGSFQIFFIFTPSWGNDPIWLIFFNWVEPTN